MTKKQKKQLAQKIASLERIVQKNEDPIKVDEAKSQIMKISEFPLFAFCSLAFC